MIKLGTRKIQRIKFIAGKGEEEKVMKWCARTGYVLTDSGPVHAILLAHAKVGMHRRLPKRFKLPKPFDIVKDMALFTAERPLTKG